MSKFILANGGNSFHLPSHTIEACLSAYTSGADGLYLTVQLSSDNNLIMYEHDDLCKQTDGNGSIGQFEKKQLQTFDAGLFFSKGKDMPWKKNERPRRLISLGALDELVTKLEDNVIFFIKPGLNSDSIEKRLRIMEAVKTLFASRSIILPVIVIDDLNFYNEFAKKTEYADHKILCDFKIPENSDLNRISFILVSDEKEFIGYNILIKNTGIRLVLKDNESFNQEHSEIILTDSVTNHVNNTKMLRTYFEEKWEGKEINTNHWVGGISSGHHSMRPMIEIAEYNEETFCASVNVDNGLHVNVVEGVTYASAGVVSKFSVGERFEMEVDIIFDNPQVANMMVFSVINQEVWDSYYHHMGIQHNIDVHFQNHAFDSHGAAPFVSMEREEQDGFRIMKYTSNAGVYEWYGNYYSRDVGNGKSTKGKLKLERRGRFFSGYYMDENNDQWVGVGTLENNSMNKRIHLRLAAKHYPKSGAPNPLKSLNVTYSNLVIKIPDEPVYQTGVSKNPLEFLK